MEISQARAQITNHSRAVVKIGTTSLTYPNGRLNLQRIERLCWVLSDLYNQGKKIILVTSGAIGVGANHLSMPERPRDVVGKQVASAVGQVVLMQVYTRFARIYNRNVAQILLSRDCVNDPEKRENTHNTVNRLLEMGVIPIVNANDTIATDELFYELSDNDTLASYMAALADCKLLVMLSDREGLYDKDPKTHRKAVLFREVSEITPKIESAAGGSGSTLGTGGMETKLNAARYALEKGIDTIIASGEDPAILLRIFAGDEEGTLFTTVGE